jgi:hypothetical protein
VWIPTCLKLSRHGQALRTRGKWSVHGARKKLHEKQSDISGVGNGAVWGGLRLCERIPRKPELGLGAVSGRDLQLDVRGLAAPLDI